MTRFKEWRQRIALVLAVVGPGFITANVDNDAGGIATYSVAGAQFGYSLLWTMIPITIALVIVQEMSSRMGAITGKGLSDLIREEFGLRATFLLMLALVATNFGNVVSEFAGIASSFELFGVSKYIVVPLAAFVVWGIVVHGTYASIEKVFLSASAFYICYIVSGVLADPDWKAAALSTVTRPESAGFRNYSYVSMIIGLAGTTIAPWMQFYLQASIVEKGVTARQYRASRLDVVVGCIFAAVVAWFIVVACAATLHTAGKYDIVTGADAAQALRPLAGEYAYLLFAAGLFNASLFAACILPLSTAYAVCEGLGLESGLDKRFQDAPAFYWLYTALIVFGAGVVLVPQFPLFRVMVLSQVVNGILLPFVLIFVILLINDRELMGTFVNSKSYNVVAWFTVVVMIVLTMLLGLANVASAQDRPFLFSVTTTTEPEKSAVRLDYDIGAGERAFQSDTSNQPEQRIGIQASKGRFTAIGRVGLVSAGSSYQSSQSGELLVSLLEPARNSLAIAAGGGVLHEASGANVLLARVIGGREAESWRLHGNAMFQKPLRQDRDTVDLVTSVGWAWKTTRSVAVGVEGIGEDLEGFWETEETEGGARLLVGPSLHVAPPGKKWQLNATGGPVFHPSDTGLSSDALRDLPPTTDRVSYAVKVGLTYRLY